MDNRRKLFAANFGGPQIVIHFSARRSCHARLLDQIARKQGWQNCNSENVVELQRPLTQRCASICCNSMSRYHLSRFSPYTCALIVVLGAWTARAFDADQKAVLDAYQKPWTAYFSAIETLGTTLDSAKGDQDIVKAADKFCDEANAFVEEFNEVRDRYLGSDILKAMDNDADAKKAFQDFVTNVKQKLDDAKPIFEKLNRQLTVYSTSADIKRVRDRLAAVSNRLQLLTL
jgi:hypothetical protein